MPDCIFCKIIRGDAPALIVYEDDAAMAFLDITPVNVGHTLVVPKAHYENFAETADDALAKLFPLVKRVAKAAAAATGAHGFNVGINTGHAAGQVVMHTHIHVMPRFDGDGLVHWPKRHLTDDQMQDAATKISALLK